MKDITWVFTLVVKTDSTTGQPTKENMQELLGYMQAQLEHLTDEMGYSYTVEQTRLTSNEHALNLADEFEQFLDNQPTGLGRLALVIGLLSISIAMFLYIGYNSRDLRYNVQDYIKSQQDYPTFR